MDLLSLGFLLLILVASGGIAFVADGLGKKIGKKRLSVAGLRPKHVAQIGTVGMGVFVSGLTIGFIMAVSRDAREWLVEGRGLLVQKKRLKQDNEELQATNKGYRTESRLLRGQNEGIRKENLRLADANGKLEDGLKKTRGDLAEAQTGLGVLKAQRTTLVAEKGQLDGQVTTLREGLRTTRLTLEESRANLLAVRNSLKNYQAAVRVAQASVATAKQSLAVATHNVKVQVANNNEAQSQNRDLNFKNRDLEEAVKAGEDSVKDLTAKRNQAQRDYDLAATQLTEANANLTEVARRVEDLYANEQKQASFLAGTVRSSRTEPMIFRKDEEVARVVIPAGASLQVATDAVERLLRVARIEASGRGAKAHKTSSEAFAEADLVPRKDPKTGQVFDTDALRRKVVASVTGRREDQALVATSSLNAFAGEVVSLEVAAMPNPVVYRRNDTVAEAQIDGSQTEERILTQLADFYHGRVRDRAVQDHMIPRSGTSAPFGEIPDADVLSLVQNVKRAGRSVRVRAVAKDDVRAADPLRLEFVVR